MAREKSHGEFKGTQAQGKADPVVEKNRNLHAQKRIFFDERETKTRKKKSHPMIREGKKKTTERGKEKHRRTEGKRVF